MVFCAMGSSPVGTHWRWHLHGTGIRYCIALHGMVATLAPGCGVCAIVGCHWAGTAAPRRADGWLAFKSGSPVQIQYLPFGRRECNVLKPTSLNTRVKRTAYTCSKRMEARSKRAGALQQPTWSLFNARFLACSLQVRCGSPPLSIPSPHHLNLRSNRRRRTSNLSTQWYNSPQLPPQSAAISTSTAKSSTSPASTPHSCPGNRASTPSMRRSNSLWMSGWSGWLVTMSGFWRN